MNKKTKRRSIMVYLENQASISSLLVTLQGTTPYIQHDFSKKARRMMLEAMQGKPRGARKAKDPEAEFLDSFICIGPKPKTLSDIKRCKFGHYANAFNLGLIRQAKKQQGITMTDVKGVLFIKGHKDAPTMVQVFADAPVIMREDVVRVGNNQADLRYRAEYSNWHVDLEIDFCNRIVSAEQLTMMLSDMGKFGGIGEFRPFGKNSSGVFGRFEVIKGHVIEPVAGKDDEEPMAAVRKAA